MPQVKALVCGGGSGAHVLAGLASSEADIEVRIFSMSNGVRLSRNIYENGGLKVRRSESKYIFFSNTLGADH